MCKILNHSDNKRLHSNKNTKIEKFSGEHEETNLLEDVLVSPEVFGRISSNFADKSHI